MRIRAALPLVVVFGLVIGVPAASAAPGWVTPAGNLSTAGISPGTIQLAANARGDVAVAWVDPATQKVFESDRPVGGAFSTGAAVSPSDVTPQQLGSVALDNSGNVYVFFGANTSTTSSLARVGTRQVGTSAWTLTTIGPLDVNHPPITPIGAVTPSGRAIAVWQQGDTSGAEKSLFEFSVKPAGSSTWSVKAAVPGTGQLTADLSHADAPGVLAVDASGDAAFAYARLDAAFSNRIVWGTEFKAATSSWTTANQISTDTSSDTLMGGPVVGIDSSGTATAAWVRSNPTHHVVQFATKALSATSWPQAPSSGLNDLTGATVDASSPSIAVEPDGTTTVSWQLGGANQESTRASGGSSFGSAAGIPTTLTSPAAATLAAGPNGGVIAIWSGSSGAQTTIGAATRASGGATFTALPNLPGTGNSSPIAGLDDQSNVPAAWLNSTGGNTTVQAAAIGAPTISNVTFPATAVTGTPFSYSATIADRWSTVTSSWAFGDGATGPLSGTHTYASPGSFLATLTATDAAGNSTQATKTVQVSSPPPPPTPTPSGPTASPTITSLKLSPTSFKAASGGASIAAAKTGTTISYKVSQQSTTTFTVLQPARGVKKGKLCVAPPKHKPKGKKLKSCQRFVSKRSFAHTDKAGPVSFRFTGRTRGHKLAPGSYRLQAIGVNAKGRGKAVVTGFKIVKR